MLQRHAAESREPLEGTHLVDNAVEYIIVRHIDMAPSEPLEVRIAVRPLGTFV
jgi:gamma-glutamylcysteine synthetase